MLMRKIVIRGRYDQTKSSGRHPRRVRGARQHARVVCGALVPGRPRHHSVEGLISLGARRSIRTHRRRCRHQALVAPAAPSAPTSRDFVHWYFADAGCRRAGQGRRSRGPQTFTRRDLCTAAIRRTAPMAYCRENARPWSTTRPPTASKKAPSASANSPKEPPPSHHHSIIASARASSEG